jgi:putative MATE family efflux protein
MSDPAVREAEPSSAELRREVTRLAVPVVGEQLLFMLVAVVDMMIAGRLEPAVLAGLGMATFLSWLMGTVFSAVGVGSTAMVARATGAGDHAAARAVTRQSLLMGLACGLGLLSVNVFLADQIIVMMGLTGDAAAFGAQWLHITGWAWLPFGVNIVGAACLRGAGDTRTPMLVMAGVNGLNLLLALALTFGVGPWDGLGAIGIAVATATSRSLGGLAIPLLLQSGRLRLVVNPWTVVPDPALLGRILRVGLPAGGEALFNAVGMGLFYRIIAELGDTAVAAHGVAVRTEGLSYLPGFGFAVAAGTLVGQSLGALRPDRAARAARTAFALGGGIMLTMGVVFAVAAETLTALFAPGQTEVIALAAAALRISALAQAGQAAAFIFAGALRGAGDTLFPMGATAAGLLLVRLPFALLLALHWEWGLIGAWAAMAADLTVRGLLMSGRFARGRWRTVKV